MAAQGNRIDDTSLIREAQQGNRAAFEVLVRHYDQSVLRLALHLRDRRRTLRTCTKRPSSRLTKIWAASGLKCPFYTWIYRIVTNLCLDHLRKRNVRKEDAPVGVDQSGEEYSRLEQFADVRSGANPERDLMRRELGQKIGKALTILTPRERMVFELKHYHGLKLEPWERC